MSFKTVIPLEIINNYISDDNNDNDHVLINNNNNNTSKKNIPSHSTIFSNCVNNSNTDINTFIDIERNQLVNHQIIREESIIANVTFWIIIGIELYWYVKWVINQPPEYFWVRLCIYPVLMMLSSFYVSIVINCIFNIFLPASWIKQNSKYYSHTAMNKIYKHRLPQLTIEIPVYKESFEEVIKPTIDNVLQACKHYQYEGGEVNIFVHDDGLMLLDDIEKNKRLTYYDSCDEIFYIGRPKENRAGRFKKASNMNFGLRKIIDAKALFNDNNTMFISPMDALKYLANNHNPYFMCGGANKYINIGKYILLLDSDSRVPERILPDLVSEMEMYKELGFMQMMTLPMQVLNDYWENAISHFTHHIYRISFVYSSATGHTAPLVGHNAMLRWDAIKDAAYIDSSSNQIMYWAEDKVSEDFDMSIRMQSIGYFGRYIGYSEDFGGFKEGVSLTACEEINRCKKYAYGINEIMFFPLNLWLEKGILSVQIKKFMTCSQIPIYTKFSIFTYITSYYTFASCPILTVAQYFLYRYNDYWRSNVINSLSIIYGCIIVFSLLMPVANIFVVRKMNYSTKSLFGTIFNEFKYSIILGLFFSGLSFHLLEAICSHMFNLNMSWSTTQKEVIKNSKFFEFKHTVIYLKRMYMFYIFWLLVIVTLWFVPNEEIQNRDVLSVVPLLLSCICHIFMPILLNTTIMNINPYFIKK